MRWQTLAAWHALAAVLLLSEPVAAAAQSSPVQRRERSTPEPPGSERFDADLTRAWLDAVERHVPGEPDDAVRVAARWSGAALSRLWSDVQLLVVVTLNPRQTRFHVEPPRDSGLVNAIPVVVRASDRVILDDLAARARAVGINVLLKRATLLHTDVATLVPDIAAAATADVPIRAGTATKSLIGDGNRAGFELVNAHWVMARMLLDRLAPHPRLHLFVRDWYRATVALAHHTEFWDVLLLDRGLDLFPDDPILRWFEGCQHEAYAAPLYQEFMRRFDGQRSRPDIAAASTELDRAERAFRRALSVDPSLAAARLRLGRVLAQQGKRAAAILELEAALAHGLGPHEEYYARLVLGGEHQAAGDLAAATAQFERAVTLEPASRVGHLALAQLARERGERETMTAHLAQALVPMTPDGPGEWWWRYRVSHAADAAARLQAVRGTWNRETP